MVLKYAAKRPDEELDGLQDLEEHFTEGNPDNVLVVAEITRHAITKTDPSDQWQATIRVKHIEAMGGANADRVRKLLKDQYGKRTGNQPLPIGDVVDGGFPDFPGGDAA